MKKFNNKMEDEFYGQIGDFPYNYYFIYKNKKYPIIFELFMGYSKYILRNKTEFEKTKYIRLIEEQEEINITISDDIINTFINFVHRQRIQFTNEKFVLLNYLGSKFEIEELIEITKRYINKHHKELVIEIILLYQNENI